MLQLRQMARELVTQGQRGGIHQVGAPDLLDVGIFGDLLAVGGHHALQSRQRAGHNADRSGDAHTRGEDVVGRLRLVDVVVGRQVERVVGELAAMQQLRAVGDHLVDVHVGLRARAGLPDVQRELVVPLAAGDLIDHAHDQVAFVLRQHAAVVVGTRGRLLGRRNAVDDFDGDVFLADLEVLHRPLCLRAPQLVGLDAHFA